MAEFGLIGRYLGHSFSKKYFDAKFEALGLDEHQFHLFELDNISDFPDLIRKQTQLKGLSVTIPYKISVIQYLDALDEHAAKIGAVNSIKVSLTEEGLPFLKGYNTDYLGFMDSLKPFLKTSDKTALILGTGGASKAVAHALQLLGIQSELVSSSGQAKYSYKSIKGIVKQFNVIVNCTPVGMYPETEAILDFPFDELTADHLLYDLIYNPEISSFINQGKNIGARCKNGLEMLSLQANYSWRRWIE